MKKIIGVLILMVFLVSCASKMIVFNSVQEKEEWKKKHKRAKIINETDIAIEYK